MAATTVGVVDTSTNATKASKPKRTYCIVCRRCYVEDNSHQHMHSMEHHKQLEIALPREPCHHCQACKTHNLNYYTYGRHIRTEQHRKNLGLLIKKTNVKAAPLTETLGHKAVCRIKSRNIELKKEERRRLMQQNAYARRKKRKEAKKVNQRKQSASQQRNGEGKMAQPPEPTQQKGGNIGIQNRLAGRHKSQNPSQSVSQMNQNREPPNRAQHPYLPNQSSRSTNYQQQLHSVSGMSEIDIINRNYANSTRGNGRPKKCQGSQIDVPEQPVDSHNGVRIFGQKEEVGNRSSQPGQERVQNSSSSASTCLNGTTDNGQLSVVNVNSMLRQIRRELGVREPCRAERAARNQKQSQEVGLKEEVQSTEQQAGFEKPDTGRTSPSFVSLSKSAQNKLKKAQSLQCPQVDTTIVPASRIKKRKSKVSTIKLEPEVSSESRCDSDGQSSNLERGSLGGPSLPRLDTLAASLTRPSTSSEPNLDAARRIRHVSDSHKMEPEKEGGLRPTVQKLLSSSGSQRKVNWNEMYQEVNRKKREKIKGMPRFGIEMKPHSDQGDIRQVEDQDLTLSEGFQWESVLPSDSPPVPCPLPSSSQSTAVNDSIIDPFEEEPNAALGDDRSIPTMMTKGRIKEEPFLPGRNDVPSGSDQYADNKTKRKKDGDNMGMATMEQGGKKRKATSNEDHSKVDQLLMVSLKEDKLCQSLQEVDNSLVQARNALQAAYTEVQRLLLLKQQFTLEVNSLRTQRIEILQGMQDGYTGTSVVGENNGSTLERATVSPRPPSRQLSNPTTTSALNTPPHRASPSSISLTQPTSAAAPRVIKMERCEPGADETADSDVSLECLDPSSSLDVIDIEDSDNEVPEVAPQRGVSVQHSCASGQTQTQRFKEENLDRTPEAPSHSVLPESADGAVEEEPALGTFMNHTGPVYGMQVHDGLLYTCSGDNTVRACSLVTKDCVNVFEGHTNKVNCLLVSDIPNMPARLYTGSSDQTVRCYSTKSKKCLEQISLPDRVLCLHIAWKILYVGVADGSVFSFDVKTLKQLDLFECHGARGVSCMSTAQEGSRRILLAGSYDSTISVRDAKSGLILRTLSGHTKTVLCLKVVNDLVFSGSSDTSVHAHNIHTGELVRIYKGHSHAVTAIAILGKVMVTASLDRFVRVYELQSHDRLQVYGGHSDMVMCMTIHKSTIYTGCYDGSVQAVRLNLMKNFRCWWHGCTLIFGIAEHLLQHLLRDHSNPQLQSVKCRWRDCNTFFTTQDAVRLELPDHMQNHVEHNSKLEM